MKLSIQLEITPGEYHSHLARNLVHGLLIAGFEVQLDSPPHQLDSWKNLIAVQKQTLDFPLFNYYEKLHDTGFPARANRLDLQHLSFITT